MFQKEPSLTKRLRVLSDQYTAPIYNNSTVEEEEKEKE